MCKSVYVGDDVCMSCMYVYIYYIVYKYICKGVSLDAIVCMYINTYIHQCEYMYIMCTCKHLHMCMYVYAKIKVGIFLHLICIHV